MAEGFGRERWDEFEAIAKPEDASSRLSCARAQKPSLPESLLLDKPGLRSLSFRQMIFASRYSLLRGEAQTVSHGMEANPCDGIIREVLACGVISPRIFPKRFFSPVM